MASWTDESLFQRPPSEDRGCHRTRNAQGPVRSHLRGRDLHRQALRRQGPKRRISGAGHKAPGKPPKIDEPVRKLLEGDLKERPFATLRERCEYVEAVSGVSVSRSTMCRAIVRIGSTRKKGDELPQSETSS
jgi:hypothetical protein